jgi:uncharacterized protein
MADLADRADLADLAAAFAATLRQAGLPVGPGRTERFASAVTLVEPDTPAQLLDCALATLVSSKDQAETLRAVFASVFGLESPADSARHDGGPRSPSLEVAQPASGGRVQTTGIAALGDDQDGGDGPDVQQAYLGSPAERLGGTDFAELSEAELAELAAAMRKLTLAVPARRSRRHRPGPGRRRTDMRSTLRTARRTGGDPFRLIGQVPLSRPRRLVVLCDISGSMEPYARAMIQLLYCAVGGAGAEVFTFATRLTRLTPALQRSLPAAALQKAGHAAPDWLGGTRLGAALKEFNDRYGRRGMARGAVVLIISDGWDTGDPAVVRREMQRLSLVAFRIVWMNPRTKSAAYEPLAGGMAAAWPYCDAVVSGHTLRALRDLTAALADPVRRRAEVRVAAPVAALSARPEQPAAAPA